MLTGRGAGSSDPPRRNSAVSIIKKATATAMKPSGAPPREMSNPPNMGLSYCQKLCMGLSCGGAILAFSIHEFDASNDLGELI